jgi:hypothetical protein
MMFWRRGPQFRTATELRSPSFEVYRNLSAREKRKLVRIAVIDDNIFAPHRNLETLEYRIDFLGDVTSLEKLTPYQIVLCDLQGVGTALDAKKQGAFLIREIKKNSPEKYVVAYTGGGLNQTITREAAADADKLLKKDADIDEWSATLGGLILKLLNPYTVWQRQREALVEREVDTLVMLKLESAFVASLDRSQPPHNKLSFESYLSSGEFKGDIRAIMQGLIASGLYALISG